MNLESDPFNIKMPAHFGRNDANGLGGTSVLYDGECIEYYLDDENRNNNLFQLFYVQKEDDFQEQIENEQAEENLKNEEDNQELDEPKIIRLREDDSQNFKYEINPFVSLNFDNGAESINIKLISDKSEQFNSSSLEQKSTTLNCHSSSYQPIKSEISKENEEDMNGEDNWDNLSQINEDKSEENKKDKDEIKEDIDKFIKDANYNEKSENKQSKEISFKNKEPGKYNISNNNQNNEKIVENIEKNIAIFKNNFENTKRKNILNKNANEKMKGFDKAEEFANSNEYTPFEENRLDFLNRPFITLPPVIDKKNCSIVSPDEIGKIKSIKNLIKRKDSITLNNVSNNMNNSLDNITFDLSNSKIKDDINLIDKFNQDNTLDNLCNIKKMRDKEKIFNNKSTKYKKKLKDKNKNKSFANKEIFIAQKFFRNLIDDKKKNNELIKNKRSKVFEEIKKIDDVKLVYCERYNYRKFTSYLNEKMNSKNKKNENHSYSHDVMRKLFSTESNLNLYEECLKDEDFHKNYREKRKTKHIIAFEFYGKYFHKIYSNNYDVSDLDLDEDEIKKI